jgi:hypothetical protein
VPTVQEQADATVALSTEQGFPQWAAHGAILRGWALAMQGQGEEGMAQVRQGITAYRATGAAVTASRHWPRPIPWSSNTRNAGGKRKSVASGASCSCGRRGHRRWKRKPGYSAPWTSPAARRPNRWSCGLP